MSIQYVVADEEGDAAGWDSSMEGALRLARELALENKPEIYEVWMRIDAVQCVERQLDAEEVVE